MPDNNNRPIKAAVVAIGDRIFTGSTHSQAFDRAIYEGAVRFDGGKLIAPEGAEINADLFMTNDGKIIDRFEASRMFGASSAEKAIEKGVMQQRPAGSTPQSQAMPDTPRQPSREGLDAEDYRGQHKAPNFESAPAFDLTGNGVYPKDVYSRPDWYEQDMGLEEMRKIQRFQGNPEAPVWIHRAIPKNIYDNAMLEGERTGNSPLSLLIKEGDWVTTNKQYAKDHGEGALNGDFKVVSKRVKAGDIFTNGDSIFEWGYYPSNPNSLAPAPMPDLSRDLPTPKGQAMLEDQRAAEQSGQPSRGGPSAEVLAKMDADYLDTVERGDMETAQRMVDEALKLAGFTQRVLHGSPKKFQGSQFKKSTFHDGFFFTNDLELARYYAEGEFNEGDAENVREFYIPEADHRIAYADQTDDESLAIKAKDYLRRNNDAVVELADIKDTYEGEFYQPGTSVFAVFEPLKIKSADTVIRDDAGNIIPLSQRFFNRPAPSAGATPGQAMP